MPTTSSPLPEQMAAAKAAAEKAAAKAAAKALATSFAAGTNPEAKAPPMKKEPVDEEQSNKRQKANDGEAIAL